MKGAKNRGVFRTGRHWADACLVGTLCLDNAEEAKTLIPSLQHKITDDDLNELLNEISKLRNFTEG